jgi:hypothetical protein
VVGVIAGDGDAADSALRRHFHIGDELRRQKALAPGKGAAASAPKTRKTKEETS